MPIDLLLIGGNDSSGYSGLAADTRVANSFKLTNESVATLSSKQGEKTFTSAEATETTQFKEQLENALGREPKVIKIGALANEKIIEITDQLLANFSGAIVIDPVFTTTSGGELLTTRGISLLSKTLLKRASVITPNFTELGKLLNKEIYEDESALRLELKQLSNDCQAYVLLCLLYTSPSPRD